jgi:hypothetical protein
MNNNGWIRNPAYDLIFFSSIWWIPLGIALLYYHSAFYVVVLLILYHLLIRIPHFAATLNLTYFLEANRDHYQKHWIRFYVMPIFIFILFSTRRFFDPNHLYSKSLLSIGVIWAIKHIAFQNYGISNLYRSRSLAKKDQCLGKLEKLVFLGLVFLSVYIAMVKTWLSEPVNQSVDFYVRWGLIALIAVLLVTYFFRVFFINKTTPTSKPAVLFFLTAISVQVYWPIYDKIGEGTAVGGNIFFYVINGHHCLAYLGLIYHMSSNQYKGLSLSDGFKKYYSPILIGTFLLMGFVSLRWYWSGDGFSIGYGFKALSFLDGVFMVHYYLESNTWKFSSSHTRETLLPIL